MPEVTRDQFEWHDGILIHMPTGALFNEKTGFVDWGPKTGPLRTEAFDPIDIGFIAGQLLAKGRSPEVPAAGERHEGA